MCSEICESWYEKFCSKRVNRSLKDHDINSISKMATVLSYRSSITRALYNNGVSWGFKGISKSNKENARSECSSIISEFITKGFNNKHYEMEQVYDLMTKVREVYHNYGVTWYTYGNAQKFVSMSFKYFFILLNHFKIIDLNGEDIFMGYNYSVVDGVIIKKEKNVHFNGKSWSTCDSLDDFKSFQNGLNNQYKNNYTNLFYYELLKWGE